MPPTQPDPPDPSWPRTTDRPFPVYRFVPGRAPHPRRDPRGHSYGQPEPKLPAPDPADWKENVEYLYGIDLYNFAYWWECHERLEALWHAAGPKTPCGQFLQGIIQVAAANLHRFMGNLEAARAKALEGLARFDGLPDEYMGVRTLEFRDDVTAYFEDRRDSPALIRLRLKP